MKALTTLLLLLAGLAAFSASPLSPQIQRLELGDREYVRLEDWARVNAFQTRWLSKTDLEVTSRWSRVQFTVDSARITLNGVSVWLSAPIVAQHGSAWIPTSDVTATLHPVLFPKKNPAGSRVRTICIDAGHGGKDPGNRAGKEEEKKYTLLLARELHALLSRAGFKVTLTRGSDSFIEPADRPEVARRRGADLFLSLHYNSAESREARGAEVYCLTPARTTSTNSRGQSADTRATVGNLQNDKNMLLAYLTQRSLVNKLGLEDRGVRRARFAVLKSAQMPAILIEGGFMSNAAEANRIYDPATRRQLAQAIVDAVLAYRKMVDP